MIQIRTEKNTDLEKIFVNMVVDKDYKDDASTFVYTGLRVPMKIPVDQIEGFTLYPREGVNLPLVTTLDDTPPDIRGLKNTPP